MEQQIRGKAYVVGDNIDTDQIIPAEYLSYNPAIPEERKYFGMYAMSGVPSQGAGLPGGGAPFVAEGAFASEYAVIIGGRNFGCGSSREHAPLAIAAAGGRAVVAEFFARIFFRNSVNGGYLVPIETPERLVEQFSTGDEVTLDLAAATLTNHATGKTVTLTPLGEIAPIVAAGGLFDYARQSGQLDASAGG